MKTEFPKNYKTVPKYEKLQKISAYNSEDKDTKLFSDNNHNLTSWIGYPQL